MSSIIPVLHLFMQPRFEYWINSLGVAESWSFECQ